MKKLHTLTGIAALAAMSLTTVTQGATIIATSDGQARDLNFSGTGSETNDGNPLTGFHTNTRNGNIHSLWAFSLADAGAPATVSLAEFSVNVTAVGSFTTDTELYAIRFSSSAAFANSDYENSDQLLAGDFWTSTDGTGVLTVDMTSYLTGSSWSPTDYIIIGTKTNPLTLTTTSQTWLTFETYVDGVTDGATLTVVPEPGTYALLGGLLSLGFVMVRRRR